MPSHQDNLAAVRAACVAANPETFLENCPQCGGSGTVIDFDRDEDGNETDPRPAPCADCNNAGCYDNGRPITLPDVLLALGKFGKPGYYDHVWYAIDNEGWLLGIDSNGLLAQQHPSMINLDLRTGLSSWSEEAVAALATLLKRDD